MVPTHTALRARMKPSDVVRDFDFGKSVGRFPVKGCFLDCSARQNSPRSITRCQDEELTFVVDSSG